MRVKATREGLIGQKTASGYFIEENIPFVALPARMALHRVVKVTNPLNSKSVFAIVLDVGPFNTDDNMYVFSGYRPKSESGISVSGRSTNGAGIDLGEYVWDALEMKDNTDVEWEFVTRRTQENRT